MKSRGKPKAEFTLGLDYDQIMSSHQPITVPDYNWIIIISKNLKEVV